MHICFVIDPWESLDENDSTLRLIHESYIRNHTVGVIGPENLTIRDNITFAFFNILKKDEKKIENINSFYKKAQFKRQMLPVKGFDVIFLRKNPPLDPIMLNFLDSVKDDTFILNDIDGLRRSNTKIYVTTLEDSHKFIPETYVSKDANYLYDIIKNSESEKMILKPLEGYGGQGVIVIEQSAKSNIRSLLDFYLGVDKKNYIIVQEYIEGAQNGDIRILLLNGEPIGAMRRRPKDGEARANVHAGGSVEKYTLSKSEISLCRKIGAKLVSDGLYFVGLDLIEGKVLEINIVSPGGITRINKLNKVKLQRLVIDFVENIHKRKEDASSRKLNFRKAVEDA